MSERTDLQGRHILLGLTGGIACYKSAELVRLLTKAGATVQVVMTEAAAAFITPVTIRLHSATWPCWSKTAPPSWALALETKPVAK